MTQYGARPEDWAAWIALGVGDHLLPAVANPDAIISSTSKLSGVGKVPCRYNQAREVVGIGKWTSYLPSPRELDQWSKESDYAISVQTRGDIKAIDVDVPDLIKSRAIRQAVTGLLGPCPVRYRDNSGKLLIPIRYSEPLPKRVLTVDGGMIEVLGDGQQFIADGYHQSGTRYQWNGTALPEMVVVDEEKLLALFDMLEMVFGIGEWKISREKREGAGTGLSVQDDPVASWLLANWETYDNGTPIHILCPFASGHSSPSGETSTSYFPAGTGGYAQGHFVCLHASCAGREDRDFLNSTGYSASLFADLPPWGGECAVGGGDIRPLQLTRDGKDRVEPSADNILKLCSRPDQIHKALAFDTFKDELIWAPHEQPAGDEQWRAFRDGDYFDVRIRLERIGVKPMAKEMIKDAVRQAAALRTIDTAQVWLDRLVWDGVERVEGFCSRGFGWEPSAYSRAVSRYIWSAMAGRVIEPGCQVDMVPILVGVQGAGKTRAIKAMAPADDHYVSVPLDGHDTDTSRLLRGKLVGELEELRGLNSKSVEAIKAWVTRTTERWVPKYMEFETAFSRRLLLLGTTNEDEFLGDPTGERRWLGGKCGVIDIEWIKSVRDQLWAEGAVKFMLAGVDWQEAQELGAEESQHYKITDVWESAVSRWLVEAGISGISPADGNEIRISDALEGAVRVPSAQQDRGKEMRMGKVLKGLGWERRRLGVQADGSRPWVYGR